ncbi:hypothetical protein TOPH_00330 [Tolypocladium ophioglossoides CBS 100239]|uniref:Uncharacterized protein n=1 Tax=Tolypocladium ophioglossoides (strain CBS 100239) TaxID=1163406 RepID=A0A0L0NLS1_TOLOC|nr:hypothetical protein TOPH_00330 [Tolypocladium ophioglossoides CBS 100239]
MASRKPDLRVSTPEKHQADTDSQRPRNTKRSPCSPRSPRSPRFREDFNAPFSEALLNASHTTFTTDMSGSFPSTQSYNSADGDSKRHTTVGTTHKTQVQPPPPLQARSNSWTSSESTRRSSVNDRIREWAKKSFTFARKGSGQSGDGNLGHHHGPRVSKPVIVNPPSENTNSDACESPDKYRQSVVAVTEVKNPK